MDQGKATLNIESEYKYQEKCLIVSGFFAGRVGNIQQFDQKLNQYTVRITIDERKYEIICTPFQIKHHKTLF